jgi:hypothetical protein
MSTLSHTEASSLAIYFVCSLIQKLEIWLENLTGEIKKTDICVLKLFIPNLQTVVEALRDQREEEVRGRRMVVDR